jgi:hypothetical protein
LDDCQSRSDANLSLPFLAGWPCAENREFPSYNHRMEKIKPFEIIASRFQMSQESAKYFLGRVQKSFKKEKPPHKLILDFIEAQNFELLLTPYEIAVMMNESGAWAYALTARPPILMDAEDV